MPRNAIALIDPGPEVTPFEVPAPTKGFYATVDHQNESYKVRLGDRLVYEPTSWELIDAQEPPKTIARLGRGESLVIHNDKFEKNKLDKQAVSNPSVFTDIKMLSNTSIYRQTAGGSQSFITRAPTGTKFRIVAKEWDLKCFPLGSVEGDTVTTVNARDEVTVIEHPFGGSLGNPLTSRDSVGRPPENSSTQSRNSGRSIDE